MRWRGRQTATPAVPVVTYSTEHPVETPPQASYTWPGAPEDPKYLSIASVNIAGYLQHVGVDQNRQVAVPNNVHLAGWFVQSVRPGERGLSIIDGHVDGRRQEGIFKRLNKVKIGDRIDIELGSGQKRAFRTVSVTTVPEKDAATLLFSQDPKVASQLNLITCTGPFDHAAQHYNDRVIVAAELIK